MDQCAVQSGKVPCCHACGPYCLYEAQSADAIRAAAARAGIPADAVIELAGRVLPSGELVGTE
ncbi:nickel-binding protein [Microbacterium deminutum]|uniref:Uncharacterized protein n=1 Tax=Microbacterium deminutum TaxID=344164 RepID=A0ABN2R6B4_9MICO